MKSQQASGRIGGGWSKRIVAGVSATVLALAMAACGDSDEGGESAAAPTLRFAIKENFAYLPIYVMIDEGILEKHIPGAKLEYIGVNSSVDAANGVVSGQVDATIAGTTSFLTAWANNVPWKIASGSSTAQIRLIAKKGRYASLKDIKPGDRIAYPSPGSIQEIVLAMAAKQQVGNAQAFKAQLQPLGEPDASNALRNDGVSLDFTQSPFSDKLLEDPGYEVVLDSKDVVGDTALGVFVLSDKFGKDDPSLRDKLTKAFAEALDLITKSPDKAAQVALNRKIGTSVDANKASIAANTYTTALGGAENLAAFMYQEGFIKREAKPSDFIDQTLAGTR
ncbi:ABC transporter substrate-binding protein [Luedemannella helvata]|uniref:ABC transporter substrate-binding protein n=2 Tax=Luedemannella helvata TaxID=349315 RepID=A0ABN2JW06_9ACTN